MTTPIAFRGARPLAWGASLVIALGAGAASAHADFILDTFDGPLGALGQNRTLSQTVESNPLLLDDPLTTEILEEAGVYAFSAGVAVVGTGIITYDGFGDGLDAVALGVTGFELNVIERDHAFPLRIVLATFDGQGNVIGESVGEVFVGSGTPTLSLADFDATGDFDATNIDQVTLLFNASQTQFGDGTPALDFAVTEFLATTPGPSVLALLGLAGLISGHRRRR